MFVLINESVHLTPVTPPKSPFEVSACKMVGCTPMSELQLPFFSGELVLLMLDVVKPGVLVPPALQLGLETDVTDPLHRVVDFFGEGMTLFEQSHFVCCIGTDGLWKSCRDGVKVIEIDSRVTLNFATNNGVIGPFNLNKVGNALVPIFGGDLLRVVSSSLVQFVPLWCCLEAISFPSTWRVSMYPLVGISTNAHISSSLRASGECLYFLGFLTIFLTFFLWYSGLGICIPCVQM